MGSGVWRKEHFAEYSRAMGRPMAADGSVSGNYRAQEMFRARRVAPELDPKNVIRECCDSEEHPETLPVILALDVTGSMGGAAVEAAKKLNIVMTRLYEKVKDVEFLIMGIGDLAYDNGPIQASQFESDIRIAEQLDKLFFEGGGGGNTFESYTAAWYFGLYHTRLDCWKRGKKGIIITLGDEPLNPYLPFKPLNFVTGDSLQADVETKKLYPLVKEKFSLYHLAIDDPQTSFKRYQEAIAKTFGAYFDNEHLQTVTLEGIADKIVEIVSAHKQADDEAKINSAHQQSRFSFFGKKKLISW